MIFGQTTIRPNAVVDRPTRPLSSYNIYYQVERQRILSGNDQVPLTITPEEVAAIVFRHKNRPKRAHKKTHGKIGFRALNAMIAARWKELQSDQRAIFEHQAKIEKAEYLVKLNAWKEAESALEIFSSSMDSLEHLSSSANNDVAAPNSRAFLSLEACKSSDFISGLMALQSLATATEDLEDTVLLDDDAPITKSIFDATSDPSSSFYLEDFDTTNIVSAETARIMSPEEMDNLFDD